jgi:hypothetical protein
MSALNQTIGEIKLEPVSNSIGRNELPAVNTDLFSQDTFSVLDKASLAKLATNIGAGVGIGANMATGANANAGINDITDYRNAYKAFGDTRYSGDYSTLLDAYRSNQLMNNPSYEDIRGMSSGEIGGNILKSGLQGFTAGIAAGPIWGAVGAALGTLGAGLGAVVGKKRALNAQKELERDRQNAINNNFLNYNYAVRNATANNQYDMLANLMALGGKIDEYPTEITEIETGGTHESNPLGGVPFGVDSEGTPNLLEEGEVVFNDYVFSKRLPFSEELKKKYKIKGSKNMSFADAAKSVKKSIEERPNDFISKNGMRDKMSSLIAEQENLKEMLQMKEVAKASNDMIKKNRKFAEGGPLPLNPDAEKYVLNDMDDNAYKGLVDLIGLNKKHYDKAINDRNYLIDYAKSGTIGPAFNAIENAYATNELYKIANKLPGINPQHSLQLGAPVIQQPSAVKNTDLDLTLDNDHTGDPNYRQQNKGYATWMRYAPVIGAGLNVMTDLLGLTNKPDYSDINNIWDVALQSKKNPDITAPVIGNYATFRPLDTLYYANQQAAQAAATRNAIQQNANGNRAMAMSGILAADRNAQNALGNLYRQAEEYNNQQRLAVEGFNRDTNKYNADNILKARIVNKQDRDNSTKLLYDAAVKKAMLKDQIDARIGAARSLNLTNLFDNIGKIGKENMSFNMVNSQNGLYYSIDKRGNINYKNAYFDLSDDDKKKVKKQAKREAEDLI